MPESGLLRWIFEPFSPRKQREESFDDGRKGLSEDDNSLMVELVLSEVEAQVVHFELEQEQKRAEESQQQKKPDYSWLISDAAMKPKKYLTTEERNRIEKACVRLQTDEWSNMISLWKTKSKNVQCRAEIFEYFMMALHETIMSRPRKVSVTQMVKRYMRSDSSANAVSDTPRSLASIGSARSIADITFRELSDIV